MKKKCYLDFSHLSDTRDVNDGASWNATCIHLMVTQEHNNFLLVVYWCYCDRNTKGQLPDPIDMLPSSDTYKINIALKRWIKKWGSWSILQKYPHFCCLWKLDVLAVRIGKVVVYLFLLLSSIFFLPFAIQMSHCVTTSHDSSYTCSQTIARILYIHYLPSKQ